MIRTLLVLLIFAFLLASAEVYGLELEKVTTSLQYLYNSFYDPDFLRLQADASQENQSYESASDSIRPIKTNFTPPNIHKEDCLFFAHGIPYTPILIFGSCSKEELVKIGVRIRAYGVKPYLTRVALSLLPRLASLQCVDSIKGHCVKAQLQSDDYLIIKDSLQLNARGSIHIDFSDVFHDVDVDVFLFSQEELPNNTDFFDQWNIKSNGLKSGLTLKAIPRGEYFVLIYPRGKGKLRFCISDILVSPDSLTLIEMKDHIGSGSQVNGISFSMWKPKEF